MFIQTIRISPLLVSEMARYFGLYVVCNTDNPNLAVVHFQRTARYFGLCIVYNRDETKRNWWQSKRVHGSDQNDCFVLFFCKRFGSLFSSGIMLIQTIRISLLLVSEIGEVFWSVYSL